MNEGSDLPNEKVNRDGAPSFFNKCAEHFRKNGSGRSSCEPAYVVGTQPA